MIDRGFLLTLVVLPRIGWVSNSCYVFVYAVQLYSTAAPLQSPVSYHVVYPSGLEILPVPLICMTAFSETLTHAVASGFMQTTINVSFYLAHKCSPQ